jgi:tetraacyldisaccharide-1-P 4'-kinase
MRRARNRRTDTFFPPEVEMTLIYEKTSGVNEWLVRKDDETLDLVIAETLKVEEDWTWKQAITTMIEDDGLTFTRIDVEIMLIAIGILDTWYESGDILPVGKYRLNAGYLQRVRGTDD